VLCCASCTSIGKLVYDNGEYYEGDWVRGKRHGKGTYAYADGMQCSDGL
jgi:hypothetical protein